jgi:hypothetical protein
MKPLEELKLIQSKVSELLIQTQKVISALENEPKTRQKYFNKTQAGRKLGKSYKTILRYEKEGKIAFNDHGLISERELDLLMNTSPMPVLRKKRYQPKPQPQL